MPSPVRHTGGAEGQGFEPCVAVLEAACSPRSILCILGERPRVSGLESWHNGGVKTRPARQAVRQGTAGINPAARPERRGGVEPLTSAVTEPRAIRYTTGRTIGFRNAELGMRI